MHVMVKNSSYTLISSIVGGFLLFLTNTLTARVLGPESFGAYTFVLAFLSLFTMIANLGMDSIVVRELSKGSEKDNSLLSSAVLLKSFFSILALGIATVLIVVLKYPKPIQYGVFIAGMTLVTGALVNLWWAVFQSRFEMIWYALTHLLGRIILFMTTLMFLYAHKDMLWLVSAHTIAGFVQLIIAIIVMVNTAPFSFQISKKQITYLVKESWPLALAGLFISLYYRIDVFMLSFWKTQEDIGYYAAVYTLTEATALYAIAWNASLYPLLSKFHENKDEFLRWGKISVGIMFFFAVWIITTTTVLGPNIISLIYGRKYEASIPVLRILVWGGGAIMINIILASMLNALGYQKITTRATGTNLILNILLNLIAIPAYGIRGAAITTVVTEVSCGIMLLLTLRKKEFIVFEKNWLWKVAVASGVVASVIYVISPQTILGVTITLIVSILSYVGLLFFLRTINQEEWTFIKHLFLGESMSQHSRHQ